jgi:AdoMet-dependent heme synthase
MHIGRRGVAAWIHAARPLRVYWETTRACDLACRHCRAEAVPDTDPRELSGEEGRALLERIVAFGPPLPHVVLTGGDALKRADLFELIAYARWLGLGVSVAPSATPLLTADALRRLRDNGVGAISLSLDGASAARHDAIRGVPGTFERTVAAACAARDVGLPFQVNTLVCAETADDLPAIHVLASSVGAARWSLFFLVTVGRGCVLEPITADAAERVLVWVASLSSVRARGELVVTTTEAPQLRRVMAERHAARASAAREPSVLRRPAHHAAGVRDGNGIVFISHTGDICPSGFLDVVAGNVRRDDLVAVYRDAPLFTGLRDAGSFRGRCGRCEYTWTCGGSRARAFAASGDLLGDDPLCIHQPRIRVRDNADAPNGGPGTPPNQ